MLAFTVVQAGADALARDQQSRHVGVRWCRFNDETLYWTAAGASEGLPDGLRRLGGPPQSAQGDLYLVVQVGNAFVNEFPDARVVINKGRYLAVDLRPEEVKDIQSHEDACFGFCALPEDAVVLDTRALTRRQPDPEIAPLVAMVSQPQLAQTLAVLTGFRTRHSLTSEFSAAADWCRAQLQTLGYASTKTAIPIGSSTSFNVIADKTGNGSSRKLVLVTAHLDSVNLAGGIGGVAPGADDNGSGVAGALEIARILAPQAAANDLRVILFGGEEQGLRGSQQYVASLSAAERARVNCVINMDMIATLNTATPAMLLEGATVSQALMDELADAAHDYTSLQVQTSLNPFASDHVPFINAGMPALLTIEGADTANHNIHTANDTVDKIHYGLASEIVRANVAVVARRLALAAGAPRQSSSPVVAWGTNRLDLFVLGTDRALYH
ncbi:MAG: hypothetical protein JWR74_2401, partial [Polaromonas sp.]|nr:hypothetical protein [Polaromonas sp.]